jgi:serine/threonine-protein kinase HipA
MRQSEVKNKDVCRSAGRAEAIVEEVQAALKKWPDFAEQAKVQPLWRKQIQQHFRLNLPPA